MGRSRKNRSRQSATDPKDREFAIVTVMEEWEQANQIRDLLKEHQIPVQIRRQEGFGGEPPWAVLVPEERLDEAHVIIESQSGYEDLYEMDGDEDQIDDLEDLLDEQ